MKKIVGLSLVMFALLLAGCIEPIPEQTFNPLGTSAEVKAYVETEVMACDQEGMVWESWVTEEVDEFGYYGNRLTKGAVVTERGGRIVYSAWVDPNNGFFKSVSCDPAWDCVEVSKPSSANPDFEVYSGLQDDPVIVGYYHITECRLEIN